LCWSGGIFRVGVTVGADVVGIGVNAIVVQVLLEWFVGESVGFDRCQTIGADVFGRAITYTAH
jgi:hypothetical protein